MPLQAVELTQLRHAHRTPRAVQQLLGDYALLAQPAEFAETRLENALHSGSGASLGFNVSIQGGEIAPGPECIFEFFGLAARFGDYLALAENHRPGGHRGDEQK